MILFIIKLILGLSVISVAGNIIWNFISEKKRIHNAKKNSKSLNSLTKNKNASRNSSVVISKKSVKLPDEVQTIILKREIFY